MPINQPINPHATVKFRPVLTLEQISYIISCMAGNNPVEKSIIKTLVPMVAKIEVGAINPAYKLSEIQIFKNQERNDRERYENNIMSPQEEADYEAKVMGI